MKKKNGFTLIELIAVLVILAILALIVTPLVMTIIKKARVSADKRSIDAYGRSVELAIANYLLDNGSFPTDISQLTVEYSGDEVVCSTSQINSDSSIYLAGCTVAGRSVDYTYGSNSSQDQDLEPTNPTYTAYSVGDEVTYNNVDYYVIEDSDASSDTVKLLKAKTLSTEEITTYSAGTGANTDNHGGMGYHSSSSEYSTSYVKTTVDAWKTAQAPEAIEARLITIEELLSLGYSDTCVAEGYCELTENVPTWVYDTNVYWEAYWTMSPMPDSIEVSNWGVLHSGELCGALIDSTAAASVRPVITLNKSAIEN